MNNRQRGFTLIELLVVIAIIGLLASITLVALNSSRLRSKDSRIIQELVQLRNQFHLDYNAGTYTYAANCVAPTIGINSCWATSFPSGGITGATWGSSPNYVLLAKDIYSQNGSGVELTLSYQGALPAPATGFAIYAKLPSISGTLNYYCVDGNGNTKNNSGGPPPSFLNAATAAVCQ